MTDTLIESLEITSTQRRLLERLMEKHQTRGDATTAKQLALDLDMKVHHLFRSLKSLDRAGLVHMQADLIWVERKEIEQQRLQPKQKKPRAKPRLATPAESVDEPATQVSATVAPPPQKQKQKGLRSVATYTFLCGCGLQYPLALGDHFSMSFECPCGVKFGLGR